MKPEEIRDLRHSLGLTQAQFADALGLSDKPIQSKRQLIWRWESGQRAPSQAALILLQQLIHKVQHGLFTHM